MTGRGDDGKRGAVRSGGGGSVGDTHRDATQGLDVCSHVIIWALRGISVGICDSRGSMSLDVKVLPGLGLAVHVRRDVERTLRRVASGLVDELDRGAIILELVSIIRAHEGPEAGAPRCEVFLARHPSICAT